MKLDDLYEIAGMKDVRVGLGAGRQRDGYTRKVVESAARVSSYVDVVVVGREDVGGAPYFFESDRPEEKLVEMLGSGEVDAVVRGTLRAEETLSNIKSVFSLDSLFRVAVLETFHPVNKLFLLAPVGIDEGGSVDEKVSFGLMAQSLMDSLDISGGISVLAGGREEDFGRSDRVDVSLEQARKTTKALSDKGVEVDNHYILIEDAIRDSSMIIPPDGVVGNLIFRTLTFLGDGKAIGAPVMNLDSVYVDTSRASDNYEDAVALAAALV